MAARSVMASGMFLASLVDVPGFLAAAEPAVTVAPASAAFPFRHARRSVAKTMPGFSGFNGLLLSSSKAKGVVGNDGAGQDGLDGGEPRRTLHEFSAFCADSEAQSHDLQHMPGFSGFNDLLLSSSKAEGVVGNDGAGQDGLDGVEPRRTLHEFSAFCADFEAQSHDLQHILQGALAQSLLLHSSGHQSTFSTTVWGLQDVLNELSSILMSHVK